MRRFLVALSVAAIGVVGMAGTSFANTNASGTFKDGPYTATTPDSGCSGNNWAQDLFVRNFIVQLPANPDGTYTVTEKFQKGHFSTFDGNSPGNACTNPGGHIKEGVGGKFSGKETIVVSDGTFDANGSCDKTQYGDPNSGWMQCDTSGWITGFFGPAATGSVSAFNFTYNASGQGLIYSHWVNADTGNAGDIASS
jgi:hypothetical protein